MDWIEYAQPVPSNKTIVIIADNGYAYVYSMFTRLNTLVF